MQALLLVIGVLVLTAAWSGVPAAITPGPFSAHMAAHMAIVAVASPLIAAALAGTRFDPAPYATRFFAPIPAAMAELVLVWLWHAPALHVAARTGTVAFAVEQITFLAVGLFLWIAAACGDGRRGVARGAAGVGALLFTSMHMTLLGALFALTPRPLYTAHHNGVSALTDQHVGGVIMLLIGGGSYLAGGLWLTRRMLQQHPREAGAAT